MKKATVTQNPFDQEAARIGKEAASGKRQIPLLLYAVYSAGLLTICFLVLSVSASGTFLDPRVWDGSYVAGSTLAESMSNGSWVIEQATSLAPWVFLGAAIISVSVASVCRRFSK